MRIAPAVFITVATLTASSPLGAQAPAYLPVFDSARSMTLRTDSVGVVRNVKLTRDSLTLHLDSGTIYFTAPVSGRVFGAVFVGRGSASVDPEYDVDRHELRRVLHDSGASWPITGAALFAADSTVAELRGQATGWTKGRNGGAASLLDRLLGNALDARNQTPYDDHLLSAILNADTTDYVLVRVTRESDPDLTFRYDVKEAEGLAVLRDAHEGWGERVVAESPLTRFVSDSEPDLAAPRDVTLGPYTISAVVDPDRQFVATTVLRFTTPKSGTRWVPFSLSELLHVDSLGEEGGGPVPFFRPSHGGALWVRVARTAGTTTALRLVYHGSLIGSYSLMDHWRRQNPRRWQEYSENPDKWLLVEDCESWYPRYDYWQPTDMDLTYRVPARYQFSSIGRLVDSTRSGDTVITHWHTERPTVWACFNVGEMEEKHINDLRIPPVVVQINHQAHASLDRFIMQQADPLENVTSDVANSLSFFSQHFGAPLYSRYYATETPTGYGQAFPGMIYLSFGTYITMNANGFEEMFRSHEMAHQWWGIGIMPAGERDAWLQEGFANFAALWYMQLILNDTTKFYRQLSDWRDGLVHRGPDVAPIGLGFRVQNQEHPQDYDLIVYEKGTWVLQMLRNVMLNLHTLSEDAFTETMRDFYARYRGGKASIRDFQRVVEEHAGQPLDWFFDQWVYGSSIPTYTFSWKADTAVNGKFPLHLRVRQDDVPGDFFMPVPVEVQFAGGRHVFLRINVRGPVTDGLVTVPEAPIAVNFNPLASVLATTRTESWKP